MTVSVVMVSYNTGPILFRAIEAALTQKSLKEIIVVDNGNPESVRERLDAFAKKTPALKVIRGQGNVGFAAACNLGAKAAMGKYLLLLNPDCIIPENALKHSVTALEKHPKAWLAGIYMVTADGQPQGGCKRRILTPRIAISEVFQLWRFFPKQFPRLNMDDEALGTKPEIVPAISGAFMLIRADRYKKVGGIDEDYFFHVEDLDFCLEVNKAGGKVLYIPTISAVHFRSTSKVSSLFVEWNKAKGFTHYFAKHFKSRYGRGFGLLAMAGIYARLAVRAGIILLSEIPLLFRGRAPDRRQVLRRAWLEAPALRDASLSAKSLVAHSPVLLIGSTGQVGISVLRQLLAEGVEVGALFHTTTVEYSHPKLRWIQGSLEAAQINLGGFAPKTLICTASVWLLPNHLEALAKAGVKRLICFSSTSLISKATSSNRYEKELVKKFNDAEKAIEESCARLGIAWTVLRPTMICGIGLDRNITSIYSFMKRSHFLPLYPPADGMRQPVHCFDLAWAAIRSIPLKVTHGKRYALSGGEKLSYEVMVRRICDVSGVRAAIIKTRLLPLALDIVSLLTARTDINGQIARRMNDNLAYDHTQAKKDFDFKPRKFLTGGKVEFGLESPRLTKKGNKNPTLREVA